MSVIYIIVGLLVVAFIVVIVFGKLSRKKLAIAKAAEEISEKRYKELDLERTALLAKEEELLAGHPYFKLKSLRKQRDSALAREDNETAANCENGMAIIREEFGDVSEEHLKKAYHAQLALIKRRLSQIEIAIRDILRNRE